MLEDFIDEGRNLRRGTGKSAWDEFYVWKQRVASFITAAYDDAVMRRFESATRRGMVVSGATYHNGRYIDQGIGVIEGLVAAQAATTASTGPHSVLLQVFNRFHAAALELNERRSERDPLLLNDEYDVQYLLMAFLRLHFNEVVAENPVPKHGGKSSRIDIHLREEDWWVEVKFSREGDRTKKFTKQLSEDFEVYRKGELERLYCFIYDPKHALLTEAREFERDLSGTKGEFDAFVFIRP